MLNNAVLMGRLVADPELRTTAAGVSVASFRIATERDFKSQQSGGRETDFFTVSAWRGLGEFAAEQLTKGMRIVVVGRLQSSSWTTESGENRTSVSIIADNIYFADSKRQDVSGDNTQDEESSQKGELPNE